MPGLRVLQVVGSYFPAVSFGGPIQSLRALCRWLVDLGCDVRVLTTAAGLGTGDRLAHGWVALDGYNVLYGRVLARPDFSLELARGIWHWVPWAGVVHETGTYNWFLPVTWRRCTALSVPLVVSPRGSLMRRARLVGRIRKGLFDAVVQRRILRHVNAIHATSAAEAKGLRGLVGGTPIATIANGVDLAHDRGSACLGGGATAGGEILYLGRLHPHKQVGGIIEAFARATSPTRKTARLTGAQCCSAAQAASRWSLIIAGAGEGSYKCELERIALVSGVSRQVRFAGHVGPEERGQLLARAQAVVLASRSENFGLAAAEALAHGTPCVVTKTAPWEGLEREGCGFWVDDSVEALADGMRRLMALSPEERHAMGERGRAWMKRDFSWESVAKRMIELYESVIEENERKKRDRR